MKTDTDIPTAVFVIVCMTVAGVFGYFTGMHRAEVKMEAETGLGVTNYGYYHWHVDASNEVHVRFTNDAAGYTLTSSNTWVPIPPIPRYYIPPSIAGTNIDSGPDMREINSVLSNLVAEGHIEVRLEEDTNRVALIEFRDQGKAVLFVYPVPKSVDTNEPPYLFDTHIDHTAPRVR